MELVLLSGKKENGKEINIVEFINLVNIMDTEYIIEIKVVIFIKVNGVMVICMELGFLMLVSKNKID